MKQSSQLRNTSKYQGGSFLKHLLAEKLEHKSQLSRLWQSLKDGDGLTGDCDNLHSNLNVQICIVLLSLSK